MKNSGNKPNLRRGFGIRCFCDLAVCIVQKAPVAFGRGKLTIIRELESPEEIAEEGVDVLATPKLAEIDSRCASALVIDPAGIFQAFKHGSEHQAQRLFQPTGFRRLDGACDAGVAPDSADIRVDRLTARDSSGADSSGKNYQPENEYPDDRDDGNHAKLIKRIEAAPLATGMRSREGGTPVSA